MTMKLRVWILVVAVLVLTVVSSRVSAAPVETADEQDAQVKDVLFLQPANPDAAKPNKLLVLIHGANVAPTSYVTLGDAIISASSTSRYNLYVGIPSTPISSLPDPITVGGILNKVVASVSQKVPGLIAERDVYLAGHSLGGIVLRSVKGYAGLILMASFLDRGQLASYDGNLLTLGGELDGMARVGRFVPAFEEYVALRARDGNNVIRRKPVIVLKDVTHSQFCSTPNLSSPTGGRDLAPVISLEDAQSRIGKVISAFIAANTDGADTSGSALDILTSKIADTRVILNPLINALRVDAPQWCVKAQHLLAGNVDQAVSIDVNVTDYSDVVSFARSKPDFSDSDVLIASHTSEPRHLIDNGAGFETPDSFDCKCRSDEALAQKYSVRLTSTASCEQLIHEAISLGESFVNAAQLKRYRESGRQLRAASDLMASTGVTWLASGVEVRNAQPDSNGKKWADVFASSLRTGTSSWFVPGMHYCKLLPPSRVVEWILVNSFLE